MKPHTHRQQMNSLVATQNDRKSPSKATFRHLILLLAGLFATAGGAYGGTPATVTLAWDPNPEPDIQRYELQYGTASGNRPLIINAGGNLSTGVPGLNPGTTYYFAVVARNTSGQASPPSTEISYTVPGTPNTAPAASAASVALDEDSEVPVTLSASDAEGDPLTYSIVTAPSKGTLIGTPPNLTFRAGINQTGNDSFTFRVFDGTLYSPAATVSVNITPINDAPVATAKSVATNEDTSVSIALSGSDPDGTTLTYTIVTHPTKGTLTGSGANRSYLPAANVTGSDSFTFKVNDGVLESPPATVTITIAPVNDAPVATPRTAATKEDTPVAVLLAGTDVEGNTLSFAIVAGPANGTLSGSPPNVTYTPKANFNGADSFAFRVNDGTSNSTAATVGITVSAVNDAPVAISRSISTGRNTAVAATLTGADPDGNPLSYAVLSNPASGTLSGTPPNLTYTPNSGYTGSDSFTFRASDGTANSGTATITISVTNTNRGPSAHPKSVTTMPKKTVAVVLSGSDPDSNPLSYRIVTAPENGTLTGTPPNLTYTPKAKWSGEDRFTFVVNDGQMDSPEAAVSVKVKKKNLKPLATPQKVIANQNATLALVLAGTDPDGDALTFAVVAAPKNGTLGGTPPNLVYTPTPGYRGKDRFTFFTSDGFSKSKAAVIDITVVNPNNRAPVAQSGTLQTSANTPVAVRLAATDADGDPLKFRLTGKPASGKLKGKLPNLTYKAKKGFTGSVAITYVANDGVVDSAPATITIQVPAPAAASTRASIADRQAKSIGEPAALPSLFLRADPSRPGKLFLHVRGTPGRTYDLEHSGDLKDWSGNEPVTIGNDGAATVELTVPEGSAGFYRLSDP